MDKRVHMYCICRATNSDEVSALIIALDKLKLYLTLLSLSAGTIALSSDERWDSVLSIFSSFSSKAGLSLS